MCSVHSLHHNCLKCRVCATKITWQHARRGNFRASTGMLVKLFLYHFTRIKRQFINRGGRRPRKSFGCQVILWTYFPRAKPLGSPVRVKIGRASATPSTNSSRRTLLFLAAGLFHRIRAGAYSRSPGGECKYRGFRSTFQSRPPAGLLEATVGCFNFRERIDSITSC
jgi:hypothetical protein